METRTRNFLLAVDEPYELYRSYHRGQLSAAPSRDIIGGECKQKREPARLSGGNQLRNCRSQAVLTGPCGGAIYQINRGEEAIPSAPDDGTSTAQHGLHMSESDQVSASEPARRRKWKATCVCHARDRRMGAKGWRRETGGGGQRTHAGHAISKPAVDRGLCREYCVVTRVILVRCKFPKWGKCGRAYAMGSSGPLFATVIRAEFPRGVISLSRWERGEM